MPVRRRKSNRQTGKPKPAEIKTRSIESPAPSFLDGQLQPLLASFLHSHPTTAERVVAMEHALRSPAGPMLRKELGKRIVEILTVLVPDKYAQWRLLVQDAMLFTALHLSEARLAPKLVEQIELPARTPPERRLLKLLAKVPGLQKLGQVLARNRHLHPSLRRALSELENGISDVSSEEVRQILVSALGSRIKAHSVKIAPKVFSEASVSAVLRFTWWNPELRRRERGVFKVLKPYIPTCYAEDMQLLHRLAQSLSRRHGRYGVPSRGVADLFSEVRELLTHEVNFRGEQATLVEAYRLYHGIRGVRVPRVIESLCAENITAMTEERGIKVTRAVAHMTPARRRRVAEQLIETLIGVPLFAPQEITMFHADPHAGNLLYDTANGQLVILDWALTGFLSREQRRHVALLVITLALRDTEAVCGHVEALSQTKIAPGSHQEQTIRACVQNTLQEIPFTRLPSPMDAIRLLERAAFAGIRLPGALILLRKVMFTLDGILHDIAGSEARMESTLARDLLRRWTTDWRTLGSPLSISDWIGVQYSALFYGTRVSKQWLGKLFESVPAA